MADGHHIHPHTCIQSEHLSDSWHFIRRQTYPYRQQSVMSVGKQSEIEDVELHIMME